MGARNEGAEGAEDGGSERGARRGIFDDGTAEVSECQELCYQIWCWEVRGKYRSMMVIRGAMRPDAHAAEVMSEVIRQARSLEFHLFSSREVNEEVVGPFRVIAAGFGGRSKEDLLSMLPWPTFCETLGLIMSSGERQN